MVEVRLQININQAPTELGTKLSFFISFGPYQSSATLSSFHRWENWCSVNTKEKQLKIISTHKSEELGK